ncbi:MAG: YecA family protein [Tepidisphaerales bacterium]
MDDYKHLVSDYHHIRTSGNRANAEMTRGLPKEDIRTAGRMLGLLRSGTLVFDSEQTMSVLMEFAMFDVFRDGSTAIQRYAQSRMAAADPDERRYLSAACEAEYDVYGVMDRIPGVGAILRSLTNGEDRRVIDMGLGATAMPGVAFAARLLCPGDYWMTSGAALPVTPDDLEVIARRLDARGLLLSSDPTMPPEARSRHNAMIIRAFLEAGASESVRYSEHDDLEGSIRELADELPRRRPDPPGGRYDPCPCGSGKKFKFCCEALFRSGQRTF